MTRGYLSKESFEKLVDAFACLDRLPAEMDTEDFRMNYSAYLRGRLYRNVNILIEDIEYNTISRGEFDWTINKITEKYLDWPEKEKKVARLIMIGHVLEEGLVPEEVEEKECQ